MSWEFLKLSFKLAPEFVIKYVNSFIALYLSFFSIKIFILIFKLESSIFLKIISENLFE